MYYTIKNIRNFAKNNTIIFVLFLLCQFTASFIILFSFGAFQNFKLLKNKNLKQSDLIIQFGNVIDKYEEDGNKYYICDSSTTNKKIKELLLSIDESSLEELDLIYYSAETTNTNIPEIYEQPNSITFRLSYSPEAKTFIQYKTSYNNSPTSSGKMISQNDFKKGTMQVVLPYGFTSDCINQEVNIENQTYKVVGIDAIDETITIPFINSPDSLDNITEISFCTKNVMSTKTYQNIRAACNNIFGNFAFIPEIDTVNDDLPFYNSLMLLSILLTILSSITLTLLFRYVLITRNKMISVFRIYGCTINKARRIFVAEIMITSIMSFLITLAIYFKIVVKQLKSSFEYIDIIYNLKNYIIIGLIYVSVIYFILNLMIIIQLHKLPLSQKQGG